MVDTSILHSIHTALPQLVFYTLTSPQHARFLGVFGDDDCTIKKNRRRREHIILSRLGMATNYKSI
ncbi:hypothetical protein BJY00DRAFT_287219 [Aspergillus carlsbadensis]|nr:hypothetical protein BJY00DRAFT_287219 [Aspergillus carlsbadensis]